MDPSRTILVVDDERDVVRVLGRALSRWGYSVFEAHSVDEAEREFVRHRPELVLLDIGLPDGSGLDFLAFLQARTPETEAIVMTGTEDLVLAAKAMSGGAIEFLSKPFSLEALSEILDSRDRRRAYDDDLSTRADAPTGAEPPGTGGTLVGRHPSMIELFKRVGLAAIGREPVLIRGETGTGKELVARTIHRLSEPTQPFMAVNCAALPDTLLEAELFGHVRGAFTGAVGSRKGRFELAGEGTILLDEIGDTSPAFQAKILRVVQEERFTPVGSEESRPMQARVVAATHRNLESMMEAGAFRSDLYYRIRVVELTLPPLREREADIPDLARHIARRAAARSGRPTPAFSEGAIEGMKAHPWPGNVRELENVVRRAVAMLGSRNNIEVQDLGVVPPPEENDDPGEPPLPEHLADIVHHHAAMVLARVDGNKREAARRLDVSPGKFYRILEGGRAQALEGSPGG